MNGDEAREAFEKAAALVKAGKHEEALAVEMMPSDSRVIQARIAASANRAVQSTTQR